MIKLIAVIALVFLAQACTPARPPQTVFMAGSASALTTDPCVFQLEHFSIDGVRQEAGYYCTPYLRTSLSGSSLNADSASVIGSPGCSFVAPYTKKDGTVVGPFMRCKSHQDSVAYKATTATSNPAPCVTSYCGPVNVKGYYRKDGTYVRPHTRRK